MNMILFGFIGCGKTHFAKCLSNVTKRPYLDTDDLIVELYKKQTGQIFSIRAIHQTLGEAAFRDLEKKVIHQLDENSSGVIALGGGAVLDPSNVAHLCKIGRLVYLKIDFDTVQKRVFGRGIPSFVDSEYPVSFLHKIYDERLPIYESIPAACVDVGILDEADVIERLCEEFSYAF
jgi:shikimate kinase